MPPGPHRRDRVKAFLKTFCRSRAAATAIEYGLIASLVAVVIVTAVTGLGLRVSDTFTLIEGVLP